MRYPAGITLFHGFKYADEDGRRKYMYSGSQKIAGAGRTVTTLKMVPKSSDRKSLVPTAKGTTNPLYLIEFSGAAGGFITGLTLAGTDQRHLYNGIRIGMSPGFRVSDVNVASIPGNKDINPGETFAINAWHSDDLVVHDVAVLGNKVGASGLGFNSSARGTVTRFTASDLRYCKAVAFWQHTGGCTLTEVESLNNAFGFGFERCEGLYQLVRPKFRGSTRADIHLASDTGRATISIVDPNLAPGQKIVVLLPSTEMGKPNLQRASDVIVTVAGKSRPDLLKFVTRA